MNHPKPRSSSRQRVRQLRVPVLPAEEADLKQRAANCGLSLAAYLRNVGMNYWPKSLLDAKAVPELLKVNADLGRLGGLLKMLLTNDERLKSSPTVPTIHAVLKDIKAAQTLLIEKVKQV